MSKDDVVGLLIWTFVFSVVACFAASFFVSLSFHAWFLALVGGWIAIYWPMRVIGAVIQYFQSPDSHWNRAPRYRVDDFRRRRKS